MLTLMDFSWYAGWANVCFRPNVLVMAAVIFVKFFQLYEDKAVL